MSVNNNFSLIYDNYNILDQSAFKINLHWLVQIKSNLLKEFSDSNLIISLNDQFQTEKIFLSKTVRENNNIK